MARSIASIDVCAVKEPSMQASRPRIPAFRWAPWRIGRANVNSCPVLRAGVNASWGRFCGIAISLLFFLDGRVVGQYPKADTLKRELERVLHSLDGRRVTFVQAIVGSPEVGGGTEAILETSPDGRYRRTSFRAKVVIKGEPDEIREYDVASYVSVVEPWGFRCETNAFDRRLVQPTYSKGVHWDHGAGRTDCRAFIGESLVGTIRGHPFTEIFELGTATIGDASEPGARWSAKCELPGSVTVSYNFTDDVLLHSIVWAQGQGEMLPARIDKWGPYQFDVVDGKSCATLIPTSYFRPGDGASATGGIRVVRNEATTVSLGKRVQFDRLQVPDETSVLVYGDEAIRYEFRSGEVVKIGDADAVAAAESARFLNPHPVWSRRNVILGSILIVATVVLVFYRIRGG
jgi:hypothetical protein